MTLQPSATPATTHPHIPHTPHITFWQRPAVQKVVPFLSSLVLHASIVVVAVLTWRVIVPPTLDEKDQPFVPVTDFIPDGEITPPGKGTDQLVPASDFGPIEDVTESSLQPSGINGLVGDARDIGIGPSDSFGTGSEPVRIGLPTGTDTTGVDRLVSIPRGDPNAIFIMGPTHGNVHRIAYVCDASGSMLNRFEQLKNEIYSEIDRLKAVQSFNVIFFGQDSATTINRSALLMANPDNKRKARGFLDDASASGETDPIPGLKLAFAQNPQLIYLLTDGDFPDNRKVIDFIRVQNKDKSVKINTIAFINRGDGYEQVLQTIARENGGTFRYVSQDLLDR